MNFQNASSLRIPEGDVRTVHDKDNRLLWGSVGYNVSFDGDATQAGTPTPDGPQPISTVTGEQTVTVTGKNLLSITQSSVVNQGTYVSGANTNDYRINATGNDLFVNAASAAGASYTSTRGNLISCNYGETIYFNVGNNDFQKNYFTEWDENLVSLGYTLVSSSSGTYTPTRQGCKYVNFRFGNGNSAPDTTYTLAPIVCKTSNTAYEPYQGHGYTIDLGPAELAKVGNYQDRIYKSDGKWYIRKETGRALYTGAETGWQTNTDAGLRQFFISLPDVDTGNIRLSSKCDRFTYNATTGFDNVFFVAGNKLLVFRNPEINGALVATTVAEWQAWLSSNNITTVYYPLATPTTTEITDGTLIAQLEAVYDWIRRHGYDTQVSGNLPIIINRTALPTV